MYTNENDVVNDGVYEYEEMARPFLARLGSLIREYYGVQILSSQN
jgi:hypothetical protein